MAIPKYEQLMQPVLEILSDGVARKNREIHEQIAVNLNLSEEDKLRILPSGKGTMYKQRTNWAITYLFRAGMLERISRGVFKISAQGLNAINDKSKVVDNSYLMQFESFRSFVGKEDVEKPNKALISYASESIECLTAQTDIEAGTPEDRIEEAINIINKKLSDDLLSEILNQTPSFFEALVVKLLVAMGYGGSDEDSGQVLGQSGDDGIDGIIKSDKLGFDRIYIQAKRYQQDNSVGNQEIRNFSGALIQKGANKGVFITTSSFTAKAKNAVKEIKTQQIVLIDGAMLTRLMIEHDIGVSTECIYKIKRIDSDFFHDD